MRKVWLILDDRMGNINQIKGVGEALGWPMEEKKISYNHWIRLPNFLRGASPLGICPESLSFLSEPWPDLVIGAGRRMFPLLLHIKKKSGGKTKVVQLMNPGRWGFSKADLIVLPRHDDYKGTAPNVFQTLGAPHRVTQEKLKEELEKWRPVMEKYPSPRISVIIGGATKKAPFTLDMAKRLAADVMALKPGSLLITTSRRTPKEVVDYLFDTFPKETTFFYKFGDAGENPYFGLLAWGGQIVVTGDSMSMCSECCAAGVPVYIFAPQGTMGKKHERFHKELYASGYATALGSGQKAFGGSLNAAKEVAERITSLFGDAS